MKFEFQYDLYCNFEYKKGEILIPKDFPEGDYYSVLDGKKEKLEPSKNFYKLLNKFFEELVEMKDTNIKTPTTKGITFFITTKETKDFFDTSDEMKEKIMRIYKEWLENSKEVEEKEDPFMTFTKIDTNNKEIEVTLKNQDQKYKISIKYQNENLSEFSLTTEETDLKEFIEYLNSILKEITDLKLFRILNESKLFK
jgi:hypothetical protein